MIYLDNAATTYPKPPSVLKAVCDTMARCGNPGRSGHKLALESGRVIMQAREELAQFMGVDDPDRLVFCFNCTDALNLAIKGIVQPGWHVASTYWEHNSVLRVLKRLQREGIITLTLADNLEDALTPNTNFAVCTHASNVTGRIMPIEKLGRKVQDLGALFLVDGAQSAGILPLTLESAHADMIAVPGHKGLFGPQGTGALCLSERAAAMLTPLKEGGTGTSSESMLQPDELPERFESGTLNTPGIAGLLEGVRFASAHRQEIYEHELFLTTYLCNALNNIKGVAVYGPSLSTQRVGVVAFNVYDLTSGQVADQLDSLDVCVRAGLHCAPGAHEMLGTLERGAVRASVGFFNTLADVNALIDQVSRIARTV